MQKHRVTKESRMMDNNGRINCSPLPTPPPPVLIWLKMVMSNR